MHTGNPASGKHAMDQESRGSCDLRISTCMAMKDSKPALLYELLNLIFNLSKGDICWRIEFLCFSPGLIGYFVLLSLRNVLLLCNRSEHVSRRV